MIKFILGKSFLFLKEVYVSLTSNFKKNKEISKGLFLIGGVRGDFDRDYFDEIVGGKIKEIKEKSSELPSISAIYRVKNGSEYIESAILSVSPLVQEIIIVDNGSTDGTKKIIEKLKLELKGIVNIKTFDYLEKTELAGDGYLERVKNNPLGSLAKYYEYCFSLGTSDYLMKCDAHYIFTAKGLSEIQDKLKLNPDVVYFSGCEIYGKELDYEPSLFKRTCGYQFIDKDRWEKLVFNKVKSIYIYIPVFLHVKRLSYIKSIKKKSSEKYSEVKYCNGK